MRRQNINLTIIIIFSAISTECPTGVTATASSSDYSVASTTINFDPNDLEEAVTVTINDDEDEEFREFFCLTITQNRGSEYYTRIYIPANDCKMFLF